MFSTTQLQTPGAHPFEFATSIGMLEGILQVPSLVNTPFLALLGHPHSLQGGTMNNKVVTTLAKVFNELNIPSIRFNFRGVGKSEGQYDAGIGESEDMLALANLWRQQFPQAKFIFAGFSFGSYVAYRAAGQMEHELLISIAPALHHYDYEAFSTPKPWIIVQGEQDEVVSPALVFDFAKRQPSEITLLRFPQASHFFHGQLINLKTQLLDTIHQQINL